MHRRLASTLATLLIGIGVGIGAVAVADDGPAARSAQSSDSRIVRELRTVNRNLATLERSNDDLGRKLDLVNENLSGLSTITSSGNVKAYLKDICEELRSLNNRTAIC